MELLCIARDAVSIPSSLIILEEDLCPEDRFVVVVMNGSTSNGSIVLGEVGVRNLQIAARVFQTA